MTQLDYSFVSDRGLKRQRNEDHVLVTIPEAGSPAGPWGSLFLVADGIGSLGMGEVASQLAVQVVTDRYYDPASQEKDETRRVVSALRAANQAVYDRSQDYELAYMGTTVAGMVLTPSEEAIIFNVGDSRVYRIRGGSMEQLSHDHAAVSADAGKTKLTAFIGQSAPIPPYNRRIKTKKGDVFLICSDGLWGVLEEKEILKVIRRNPAENAVRILQQMVYERGAKDNITIVIVRLGTLVQERNLLPGILIALIAIVALAMGAFLLTGNDKEDALTASAEQENTSAAGFTIVTLSPTATETATATLTPNVRQTRTANALATDSAAETVAAETATANAEGTADARATNQAEATQSAIQAATVFSVRTQTAIAAATYFPATETQSAILAATVVEVATEQQATQVAIQIASQSPTPTLNPTLITYTPSPSPTQTFTPSMTFTPSPTFTPSMTFTPSATPTPTLSLEEILELAEIGTLLAADTRLILFSPHPFEFISQITLPATTRIKFLGERTQHFVRVQVLTGDFASLEGWMVESAVLEGTPALAYAVTTTMAAVRSGNSVDFPRLSQLEPNTRVPILGISNAGERWYLIKLPDGREAWIAPSVVQIEGDSSLIPGVKPPPSPGS
ncbi:MAG: protein phosphatase 2C domain-containing protein [Anaerolineae bacterium]|nr:protein phosphatase 2C domain-containing protein [Anaerolineae bacterium]